MAQILVLAMHRRHHRDDHFPICLSALTAVVDRGGPTLGWCLSLPECRLSLRERTFFRGAKDDKLRHYLFAVRDSAGPKKHRESRIDRVGARQLGKIGD